MDRTLEIAEKQGKTFLAALIVGLTLVCTLFSWRFYAWLNVSTPTQEDWNRAAEIVKAEFLSGDFVAVTPFWATTGEKAFVDQELPYRYVRWIAREDWPNVERLWVVSGYDRFRDRDVFLSGNVVSERLENAGPLQIERFRFENPLKGAFVFHERLSEAEVFTQKGKDTKICKQRRKEPDRFDCDNRRQWHHVGRKDVEIGDAVRPVIWAHPVAKTDIHIKFQGVRATHGIVLTHGLSLYAAADPRGKEVFIDVFVDGRKIGRAVQKNIKGWHRMEIPFRKVSGNIHDVDLVVSAEKDGRRHFVFDGYAY